MKIVHIAHSADGGAGRAANRASAACNSVGLQSTFAYIAGPDPKAGELRLNVTRAPEGSTGRVLEERLQWGLIPETRTEGGFALFSIAYPGADLAAHPDIAAADIIHLHWPTWTVTPPVIRELLDAGKTVFVTLHDMWMFTGGCHYSSGCAQFQSACMKCPQLADRYGLAGAAFEDKLAAYGGGYPRFHVVALCNWMHDLSTSSRILGDSPTHRIPNPIETDIFTPLDRDTMRGQLGITPQDAVLLFGSFDNGEVRKGGAILRDALQELADWPEIQNFDGRIYLMSFGRNSDLHMPAPFVEIDMGLISDDKVMAGLYNLADILCFPSIEDNYPNSIIEAAACGTPSVAFRTGGMADMIRHDETGYLVDALGNASDYAKGLAAALVRFHGDEAARTACQAGILRTNTMPVIGQQLAQAYESAVGKKAQKKTKTRDPVALLAGLMEPSVIGTEPEAPVLASANKIGSEFAKFPLTEFLRSNGAADFEQDIVPMRRYAHPDAQKRLRILAVRSFHEHHSAYAGPYQFLRHLPADRFEVCNITVPLGDDLVTSETVRAGARRAAAALGFAPFGIQSNSWAAEWQIARRLRQEPFDIVHFVDGELSGALVARLPDAFFHGGKRPAMLSMLHQPEDLATKWTSAAALARFDRLGALANRQTEFLRERVPEAKTDLVPHGVDTDFFCPDPKAGTATDSATDPVADARPLRLLAVGHWLRDYQLAFAALDQLVADGIVLDYRVICHSIDKDTLPGYVTLLSGLTDAELREEYRAADLVFMPLQAATANNTLLEAMACGTPVVSTDVGGVGEYVAATAGRVCAPTAEACAEAIRLLMADAALRQAMGQAARAHAETLDWRHIAARYGQIYKDVAMKRQAGDLCRGQAQGQMQC